MENLSVLRARLLELHKALIDAERVSYEALHGRTSAQEFLQALTRDPSLRWLAPLNLAIVRLDELLTLQDKDHDDADDLPAHLGVLRRLLDVAGGDGTLGPRYGELVQSSPDVAFAHGALWSVLRQRPGST
jgi:hypothetical protein